MPKSIIALDIDDVLSDSMEAVRLEVNERLGIDLQTEHYSIPGDYWGYYEKVWAQHKLVIDFEELDEKLVKARYLPMLGAKETLQELTQRYQLIAITSRKEEWKTFTLDWLEKYFPGVIDSVTFAGNKEHDVVRTKGEVCAELGAKWLIDDNVGHCLDAREHDVTPVLFGNYGWQHAAPGDIARCKNWAAVLEYFNGQH
jgi:5'(3')-deoxyribonucleotidase